LSTLYQIYGIDVYSLYVKVPMILTRSMARAFSEEIKKNEKI